MIKKPILVVFIIALIACNEKTNNKPSWINNPKKQLNSNKKSTKETIDLDNIGVGPITSITLDDINSDMRANGKSLFKSKCTACHKLGKKYIGPDLTKILSRRSPEWVMNMILNPGGMVKDDPIAKQLLIEYNGTPMANQSLTEDEARDILEFLR